MSFYQLENIMICVCFWTGIDIVAIINLKFMIDFLA